VKVLIGCEQSGVVRRAFAALGHDVWSVDFLPAEDRSNRHIIGDIRDYLTAEWDLLAVFHPPCTRLCNSGVRWLHEPPGRLTANHYGRDVIDAYARMDREQRLAFMWDELEKGAALFSDCWNAPIPRVAVENPVMHRHAKALIVNYEKPAQTVQPWWFGEPYFKATSFYLRGLEPLVKTNRLTPRRKARTNTNAGVPCTGRHTGRTGGRPEAGRLTVLQRLWRLNGAARLLNARIAPGGIPYENEQRHRDRAHDER